MIEIPMFPLNAVVYPGQVVPLAVFEERYVNLVEHLLQEPDSRNRVFGTVAIREGYEVGDHGVASLFRVGVFMEMTHAEPQEDGTYHLIAVGRDRLRLDALRTTNGYPEGSVEPEPDIPGTPDDELVLRTKQRFLQWQDEVSGLRSEHPSGAELPRGPGDLAWAIARRVSLPLPDRHAVLASPGLIERFGLLDRLLHSELITMAAFPSLPANHLARDRWSPN